MINVKRLSEVQLDALKEVANIGSGHAATALSKLLGKKIMIRVPKIITGTLNEILSETTDSNDVIASVFLNFLGDLTGRTLILFPYAEIQDIFGLLIPEKPDNPSEFKESLLKEVSNILSCSYMNALGELLGLTITPTVPGISIDIGKALLSNDSFKFNRENEFILCIETEFDFGDDIKPVIAYFLLISDTESLELILKKLDLIK